MFSLSAIVGATAPLAYTAEQQGMEITALPGAPAPVEAVRRLR